MSRVTKKLTKGGRTVLISLLVVGSTATVAWATTGSVANDRSVVFYYGEAAGANDDSRDFTGSGRVKMCMNSDGGSGNTYVGKYVKNRSFLPDSVLRDVNQPYNQGKFVTSIFSISSDHKYHTSVSWSAVPSLPNNYNGYVATRYAGLVCS
jgi:hypothetical protein